MQLDELDEQLERELAKPPAENQPKPMWTCPDCGHQFVVSNAYHSCGNYNIDDHFAGKELAVRRIFEELTSAVEQFNCICSKDTDRIPGADEVFGRHAPQTLVNRTVLAKKRAEHPRIYRVEMFTYRDFGHLFRLHKPEDMDESFVELLHEAYALGSG